MKGIYYIYNYVLWILFALRGLFYVIDVKTNLTSLEVMLLRPRYKKVNSMEVSTVDFCPWSMTFYPRSWMLFAFLNVICFLFILQMAGTEKKVFRNFWWLRLLALILTKKGDVNYFVVILTYFKYVSFVDYFVFFYLL